MHLEAKAGRAGGQVLVLVATSWSLVAVVLGSSLAIGCDGEISGRDDGTVRDRGDDAGIVDPAGDAALGDAGAGDAAAGATLTMPIEVMSHVYPYERAITIETSEAFERIRLRVHNVLFESKASLRVNDGSWVDVTNANVSCDSFSAKRDCVGTLLGTIRFEVDVDGGRAGASTVAFRLNETDGVSSGYRVLDIDALASDGRSVMTTTLVMDEPARWTAPEGADPVHGEELFRARSLLVERPGSSDGLVASCADCHERDGRDLQYFAYSSYSIIARSEFHGLSREDGRDIAAYIRGLALLDRDGNPYPPPGRPWNPPYQPGPGLDDRPIHEWAAGAGLEWVLASDDETREHLFPDGIDHEAMSRGVNLRELPVAVQFPDWNQWLPRVHPLDSWGDTAAWQDALAEYEGQRDLEEPGDYRLWNLVSRVGDLRNQSRADGWDYLTFITARNSAQRWGALRLWEIHQFNHLQDRVNEVSPEVEPRGWLRSGRVIFDLGPHILGNKGEEVNEGQWYFGAGRRGWGVWTHKWYYAQSVIAPGGNNRTVQTPVDWGYQGAFERSYAGNIEPSGWRAVALWLERMEIMTIPCSTAPGTTRCFGSHTATPAWLGQATDDGALYANVSAEDRARLLNWGIDAWVDAAERWEPDDYVRDGSVGSWEDASYVPSAETHRDRLTHQRHPAAYVFQKRADFVAFGVSARVCERLGAWGASMWPLDDWASFDCGAAGDPP